MPCRTALQAWGKRSQLCTIPHGNISKHIHQLQNYSKIRGRFVEDCCLIDLAPKAFFFEKYPHGLESGFFRLWTCCCSLLCLYDTITCWLITCKVCRVILQVEIDLTLMKHKQKILYSLDFFFTSPLKKMLYIQC